MLSGFRRPAADFRVELSATTLEPGDELNIRVSLIPRDGFQVRRGRVTIECEEIFVVQSYQTRTGITQPLKTTHLLSRWEEVFMADYRMRRGLPYFADVNYTVPQGAQPTVSGVSVGSIRVGIAWTVTTHVDVAGARDFHDSQNISVVMPAAPSDAESVPVVAQSEHDWCALTLTLPTEYARSHDTLEGVLRAQVSQDIDLSEVRAQLVRVETFGENTDTYEQDMGKLDDALSLRRGETREWRFQLNTGQVDAPSLRTDNSVVTWLVKCVLARRMRFDARIEQEIWVDA